MNVIGAILPLLFWVVILIGLYIFKPFAKLNQLKGFQWIFAGYVSFLLLAVILYYILPFDHTKAELEKINWNEDDPEVSFIDQAYDGQIGESQEVVLKKEWAFPLKESGMNISMEGKSSGKLYGAILLAERTEKGSPMKVEHYVTRSIIDGFDVTEAMKPPEIRMEGETLLIRYPDPVELNISQYISSFTTRQFNGEELWESESLIGSDIIYLRIPEGVEVTGPVDFIEGDQ